MSMKNIPGRPKMFQIQENFGASRQKGSGIYPNVAKAGGLQGQGAKGATVAGLLQARGQGVTAALMSSFF
jgi:hypothetical protein